MHQAAVCAWLPVEGIELSAVPGLRLTTPPSRTLHISAAACSSLPAVEHVQHGTVSVAIKLQLFENMARTEGRENCILCRSMTKLKVNAFMQDAKVQYGELLTTENVGAAAFVRTQ